MVDSPVYLDANFLVCYAVESDGASAWQTTARNVMGDLLVQRVTILISLVTVEEAWWATLHELYCRHIWRPTFQEPKCRFNRYVAEGYLSQLMQHKADLKKIVDNLQELRSKGADIRFIPDDKKSFLICQDVPDNMHSHNLLSADALHLSLALAEAKTLITFDVSDFQHVLDQSKDLTIILLS